MRKYFWNILFAIGVFNGKALGVSLKEAQDRAIERNLDILVVNSEAEEAAARLKSTQNRYNPAIGVAGGGELEAFDRKTETSPLAYVFCTYNVYNSGQSAIENEIARSSLEKSRLSLSPMRFLIAKDVEEIFSRAAYIEEVISIKRDQIKENEKLKRGAQGRLAAGLIGRTDVSEFALKDSLLRREILILAQEKEEVERRLQNLLREEGPIRIDAPRIIRNGRIAASRDQILSLQREWSLARKAAEAELKSLDLETELVNSKWGPRIDLEAQLGFLPSEKRPYDVDAQKPGASIMLVGKWNLFSVAQVASEKNEIQAR